MLGYHRYNGDTYSTIGMYSTTEETIGTVEGVKYCGVDYLN